MTPVIPEVSPSGGTDCANAEMGRRNIASRARRRRGHLLCWQDGRGSIADSIGVCPRAAHVRTLLAALVGGAVNPTASRGPRVWS